MPDGIYLTEDSRVLDALIANGPTQMDEWLGGVAEQINNEIVLSMNTSPPGREYRRGSVTHVASQPGYPPNVDIGTLRASMHVTKVGRLHFEIRDGVEYGIYLEDGTESMGAWPFVGPVFNQWGEQALARDLQRFGLLP